MSKFSYMLLAGLTLAAQVVNPLPSGPTASAQAETNGVEIAQSIYTATVVGQKPAKPDFDIEVVAPLKAKQAAEEAAAQAKIAQARAKAVVATPKVAYSGDLEGAFALIRQCEAGNVYTRNSGNGYYGAYQYNLGTWANYGGYARPDLAPPAVQDAKAHQTQAARGWSPWPACARKLGLL